MKTTGSPRVALRYAANWTLALSLITPVFVVLATPILMSAMSGDPDAGIMGLALAQVAATGVAAGAILFTASIALHAAAFGFPEPVTEPIRTAGPPLSAPVSSPTARPAKPLTRKQRITITSLIIGIPAISIGIVALQSMVEGRHAERVLSERNSQCQDAFRMLTAIGHDQLTMTIDEHAQFASDFFPYADGQNNRDARVLLRACRFLEPDMGGVEEWRPTTDDPAAEVRAKIREIAKLRADDPLSQ